VVVVLGEGRTVGLDGLPAQAVSTITPST